MIEDALVDISDALNELANLEGEIDRTNMSPSSRDAIISLIRKIEYDLESASSTLEGMPKKQGIVYYNTTARKVNNNVVRIDYRIWGKNVPSDRILRIQNRLEAGLRLSGFEPKRETTGIGHILSPQEIAKSVENSIREIIRKNIKALNLKHKFKYLKHKLR